MWVQFGVIRNTSENFQCSDFQKGCCSPSFHPISTKPYIKHHSNLAKYQLQCITFSGCLPDFKSIWWYFEDKLHQLHCQYPQSYAGFIWQQVEQSLKAPGPLVFQNKEYLALQNYWQSVSLGSQTILGMALLTFIESRKVQIFVNLRQTHMFLKISVNWFLQTKFLISLLIPFITFVPGFGKAVIGCRNFGISKDFIAETFPIRDKLVLLY